MNVNKLKRPALWAMLCHARHVDMPPIPDATGCAACPFSEAKVDVNPADPDEGIYRCLLTKREDVWGEEPVCSLEDWQARARDELAEALCE